MDQPAPRPPAPRSDATASGGHQKRFYGWYIVGLAFLVSSVSTFSQQHIQAPVQLPMSRALGVSASALLTANLIRAFSAILFSPFAGRAVDRPWGPKVLLTSGGVIAGVALIATGFVTQLWQYYALRIVVTFGTVMASDLLMTTLVARWFKRKRGRAIGWATMGVSFGSIFLLPITSIVVRVFGWEAAWFLSGSLLFSVMVLGGLFVVRPDPQSMGLHPDGEPPTLVGEAHRREKALPDRDWTVKEALKTPVLWSLSLAFSLASLGALAYVFNLPSYGETKGISPTVVTICLTAYPIGTSLPKPFWGWMSETFPPRRVATITFLGFGVTLGLLALLPWPASLVILSFFVGFFVGANGPMQVILLSGYYGTAHLGAIRGAVAPMGLLLGAAAPMMAALVYERTGSYAGAFLGIAALQVVAIGCLFLAGPPKRPAAASADLPAPSPTGETN